MHTVEPAHPSAGALDRAVERLGRWAAARTSRRSFLGRLGRVGVIVAAGPSAALILAGEADAETRVCGQSGTAPKCPTYDCDSTWGWCWYASGCCTGGHLKKICDCCAPVTPHPRGYCPHGTRVRCIVESCGADPRLQTRDLVHLAAESPAVLSVAVSRQRFSAPVPMAVIGDGDSSSFTAPAISLGAVVDGPVLLTSRRGVDGVVRDELARLGVEHVVIAGSLLSATVDADLAAQGLHGWRIATSPDLATFTAEVAEWSRQMTGRRTAVAVASGAEQAAVPPAAALANSRRLPLLIGEGPSTQAALHDPRPVTRTLVVTTDAGDAGRYPGGEAVVASSATGLADRLADVAVSLGATARTVTLAPRETPGAAAGAATWPAPLLLFASNSVEGARDGLLRLRGRMRRAVVASPDARFGSPARYDLQSIINEYEAHWLRGSGGEGLPVIEQPYEERPIGEARDTR